MSSLSCDFKSWASASVYRTVADSYTKSDVDTAVGAKLASADLESSIDALSKYALSADVPDVSGKLNTADLETAVDALSKYATSSGVDSAISTALVSYTATSGLDTAIDGLGYLKAAGVATEVALSMADYEAKADLDTDVAAAGYQKSADVSSAISSAISGLANASDVFAKANTDLNKLFRALENSLSLQDPDTPANPFDWSSLVGA